MTPPLGAVDPGLPRIWIEALGDSAGLMLLARQLGDDPEPALEAGGRLDSITRACHALGIPVLCSASAGAERQAAQAVTRFGLAGAQLRGDPSADRIAGARGLMPTAILGRSVHGDPPTDVTDRGVDVDYTCLAPVFEPRTPPRDGRAPKHPCGLDTLRAWAGAVGNVVALGGVEASNARDCARAGARGLASISTFFGPPARVAENIRTLVSEVPALGSASVAR